MNCRLRVNYDLKESSFMFLKDYVQREVYIGLTMLFPFYWYLVLYVGGYIPNLITI